MPSEGASSQDQPRFTAAFQPGARQQWTSWPPSAPAHVPLRTNLPTPITSFIGRASELAEVQQCLAAARLVCLVGAGGVGKTRLALRLAEQGVDSYPDGVLLAELAPLADAALVPQVVARAVGVREQAGEPITQTLKQALRFRRMLLLLDNCEHLAQACAELAEDLLGACPDLRILVTSREPLGTSGEVAWRVPSLSVPDSHRAPTAEQVLAHAATQLFVERATAARPEFQMTSQNAPAIIELCRRLDGIPLALELAATRVRLLSVEQIVARLDDRFRLLAGTLRTAPPRQRTLRATLDWSFALLEDSERQLFNRLSVFAGGWTLDAAEAICAGDRIDSGDVLDLLGRLVDQSLVVADHGGDRVRYRLLETVRQYAAEKLADIAESASIGRRHRDWFLAQAESSQLELFDPRHVAWLADELDNLRAGLHWSIERSEVEPGLRMAIAVSAFWHQRGAYAEGRACFGEVLRLPGVEAAPSSTHALALLRAALLAALQSDLLSARALCDESLTIVRRSGDMPVLADAECVIGIIAWRHGDLEAAEAHFEEGRFLSHAHGHAATEFYCLLNLALVALERGDPAAEEFARKSLALAERIGHARGRPSALYALGRAAASLGRMGEARVSLEEALALHRLNVDRDGIEVTLRGLAQHLLDQGEASGARTLLAESLALAHEGGDQLEMARALEGLVGTAVTTDPRRAVRLAAAATTLRKALRAISYPKDRERLDDWLEVAHSRLGQPAYEMAWNQGQALSPEQAVHLGLEEANHTPGVASDPLSTREQEVAQLVARGCTNREIAEQLVIAPRTADTHVGNILSKLNLHSRAELAAWAVTHGLSVGRSD
jgi:predicted ATPase/DNA-binding CsgD family transcriptional regulator